MADETPSEGHKKVRKKISVYQTAVDINKKQKEIKKNVAEGGADINTVTEEYEGKFNDKLESPVIVRDVIVSVKILVLINASAFCSL